MNRSPRRVAQDAALAAGGLGDQGAGGVLGLEQPGRVELHQLGVAQAGRRRRRASRNESPVFSSRRDEVRRQIRVWPPAARITASAWIR